MMRSAYRGAAARGIVNYMDSMEFTIPWTKRGAIGWLCRRPVRWQLQAIGRFIEIKRCVRGSIALIDREKLTALDL